MTTDFDTTVPDVHKLDKAIILIALNEYLKALERTFKKAPTIQVQQAYRESIKDVEACVNRVRNHQLEF